jgi:hypothetical protein
LKAAALPSNRNYAADHVDSKLFTQNPKWTVSASDSRRLTKIIGVRVLPGEHRELLEQARAEGISLSAFIRKRVGLPTLEFS